jgi:hypothetical protein
VRTDRENIFGVPILGFRTDRDWQWRVATRTSQHHLAAAHYADDRIIDVPNDWPIVNEKHIGDSVQTM